MKSLVGVLAFCYSNEFLREIIEKGEKHILAHDFRVYSL